MDAEIEELFHAHDELQIKYDEEIKANKVNSNLDVVQHTTPNGQHELNFVLKKYEGGGEADSSAALTPVDNECGKTLNNHMHWLLSCRQCVSYDNDDILYRVLGILVWQQDNYKRSSFW